MDTVESQRLLSGLAEAVDAVRWGTFVLHMSLCCSCSCCCCWLMFMTTTTTTHHITHAYSCCCCCRTHAVNTLPSPQQGAVVLHPGSAGSSTAVRRRAGACGARCPAAARCCVRAALKPAARPPAAAAVPVLQRGCECAAADRVCPAARATASRRRRRRTGQPAHHPLTRHAAAHQLHGAGALCVMVCVHVYMCMCLLCLCMCTCVHVHVLVCVCPSSLHAAHGA